MDRIQKAFPIGARVQVTGEISKLLFKKDNPLTDPIYLRKEGIVVDVAGKYIIVDFEQFKDLKYIYYQDLRVIS